MWEMTHDAAKVDRTAIIQNGSVNMANLCCAACYYVNGVSALHSELIRCELFSDFASVFPHKFGNVTNGIAHRRWLCQSNPKLTALLKELIGDGFVRNGEELAKLRDYENDPQVLHALQQIKHANKQDFAQKILKQQGITLNPNTIFDVQIKRLHEYKRQHLNAFHILADYLAIKENPARDFVPKTYLFAAKAASGYFMAKQIIRFVVALGELINNDPDVAGRLQVHFLENYCVSMAESLIPAAEISQQISLAGTEASGTGNMKLMMNGALTLGTLDGANVEIGQAVGDDNIFIFGLRTDEVERLRHDYTPMDFHNNNPEIRRVFDFINAGVVGIEFRELWNTIHWDPYLVLADFADYRVAQAAASAAYRDTTHWNRMALRNIAASGIFAADRAVGDYARDIWKI